MQRKQANEREQEIDMTGELRRQTHRKTLQFPEAMPRELPTQMYGELSWIAGNERQQAMDVTRELRRQTRGDKPQPVITRKKEVARCRERAGDGHASPVITRKKEVALDVEKEQEMDMPRGLRRQTHLQTESCTSTNADNARKGGREREKCRLSHTMPREGGGGEKKKFMECRFEVMQHKATHCNICNIWQRMAAHESAR